MAFFFLGVVVGALVATWTVERFYRLEARRRHPANWRGQ